MGNKIIKVLTVLCLISFTSCSQNNKSLKNKDVEVSIQKHETKKTEPHRYGGWYCPDNLNGFPAVDIANWKDVPVERGLEKKNKFELPQSQYWNFDILLRWKIIR